jgi:hypothetical protein
MEGPSMFHSLESKQSTNSSSVTSFNFLPPTGNVRQTGSVNSLSGFAFDILRCLRIACFAKACGLSHNRDVRSSIPARHREIHHFWHDQSIVIKFCSEYVASNLFASQNVSIQNFVHVTKEFRKRLQAHIAAAIASNLADHMRFHL